MVVLPIQVMCTSSLLARTEFRWEEREPDLRVMMAHILAGHRAVPYNSDFTLLLGDDPGEVHYQTLQNHIINSVRPTPRMLFRTHQE